MASKRDYYEVLGVGKSSDKDEIKKAYRKMAMQHHPDRNPGDAKAEEMFKEAAEAYEVLSDDDKRARYDRFGHAGMGNSGGGGGGYTNMDDIFSRFSDIFGGGGGGGGFESFFGGGGRRARPKGQRGSDLRVKVALNMEEIYNGVEKRIKLNRFTTCDTCNGNGADGPDGYQTCTTCAGAGEIRRQAGGGFFQQIVVSACPTCQGEGRTELASALPDLPRRPAGLPSGRERCVDLIGARKNGRDHARDILRSRQPVIAVLDQ